MDSTQMQTTPKIWKVGDALIWAWESLNSWPERLDLSLDRLTHLNSHMQQLIPGPYTVTIEHDMKNVADDPKLRLVLHFNTDASDEEICLFRLRHF